MNIYFDTEFTGLHKNTTLISIGAISEDGSTFYGELTDFHKTQCDDWITNNVISNLHLHNEATTGYLLRSSEQYRKYYYMESLGKKKDVAIHFKDWLSRFDDVQFISDVSHYDFVLLIDLLGDTAFDLPSNCNPSCHDINQDIRDYYGGNMTEREAFEMSRENILKDAGITLPDGDKHNSLYDAKVIKEIYNLLKR